MKVNKIIAGFLVLIVHIAACFPFSLSAVAATVVLDFEGNDFSGGWQNASEAGFRISANSHLDWLNTGYFTGVSSENTLLSTCSAGGGSPFFLGPETLSKGSPGEDGVIYIDKDSHPFQLKSLLVYEWGKVISSKGGYFEIADYESIPYYGEPYFVEFEGPEWTGVKWIALYGIGGEPVGAYDNIALEVSEPPPYLLLAIGLFGFVCIQRRMT